MNKEHRFPYEWNLKDAIFTKDKGKAFSCFACGGGSTMGYKLAGFDVIGCNEIDPKMMAAYKANHNPKYSFLEPIQTFKLREDLPKELYKLDILDGSPPCSSFSMAGSREKSWGKEKVFREGQAKQVLDTLFFDFIGLAEKLKPKIVIAENVKGLLLGNARDYVRNIYTAFDKAGYYVQHFLLDASKMGVPQRRERVFFIAMRKDLAKNFLCSPDMFTVIPKLELSFNEKGIIYNDIYEENAVGLQNIPPSYANLWAKRDYKEFSMSETSLRCKQVKNFFSVKYIHKNKVLYTITADDKNILIDELRCLSKNELCKAGTYPLDYDFVTNKVYYLIGMSVPPVMTAQIATEIFNQWISKF